MTTATMRDRVADARVHLGMGRRAEADALLDAILAEDPRETSALLLKAGLLLEGREADAALALFERAVASAPRSAEALDGLARGFHALARDGEALDVALRARALLREGDNFRHTTSVHLTLVWCLREMRRYAEALEMAEEGLAAMPDAILAHWASIVEEEYAESQKEEC